MTREEVLSAFANKTMVKVDGVIGTIRILDDKDSSARLDTTQLGWIPWSRLEIAEEEEAELVRAHRARLVTLAPLVLANLPRMALTPAADDRLDSDGPRDGLRFAGVFPDGSVLAVRVSDEGALLSYTNCLRLDDIELVEP